MSVKTWSFCRVQDLKTKPGSVGKSPLYVKPVDPRLKRLKLFTKPPTYFDIEFFL
jgi:hypothetical protein